VVERRSEEIEVGQAVSPADRPSALCALGRRNRLPHLGACMLATLLANAQASKPGTVEGTVINSVTSGPVPEATVTLTEIAKRSTYEARTDAAGHFSIANVEPGRYTAGADHSGFWFPARLARAATAKPIAIAEEEHVKNVGVKLEPFGSIRGRVVNDDGEPVGGATVTALMFVYRDGRRIIGERGEQTTNDRGEYQIPSLAPGRYFPRVKIAKPRTDEIYPVTLYPNALDFDQASPVQVAPGSQAVADIRVRKAPGYRVRGKIVGPPGGRTEVILAAASPANRNPSSCCLKATSRRVVSRAESIASTPSKKSGKQQMLESSSWPSPTMTWRI
jgi:hypothetical protein